MANEAAKIRSWIAYELLSDNVLQPLVGENIFAGFAPENAGELLIIYSFAAGSNLLTLGHRRSRAQVLFDIKVYQKGTATGNLKLTADRVDELFANFKNRVWNGFSFSSWLEDYLQSDESNEVSGRWVCLGGTYRIAVKSVT